MAEKKSWLQRMPRGWASVPFLLLPAVLVVMIVGPFLGLPQIVVSFLAPILALDFIVALITYDFIRSPRKR
jgi:hypothetical protein